MPVPANFLSSTSSEGGDLICNRDQFAVLHPFANPSDDIVVMLFFIGGGMRSVEIGTVTPSDTDAEKKAAALAEAETWVGSANFISAARDNGDNLLVNLDLLISIDPGVTESDDADAALLCHGGTRFTIITGTVTPSDTDAQKAAASLGHAQDWLAGL